MKTLGIATSQTDRSRLLRAAFAERYRAFVLFLCFTNSVFSGAATALATDHGSLTQVSSASCNEPFGPISADDSPNKSYFKDLLKRGESAPIDDFMKLWYPDQHAGADTEAFFNQCQQEPFKGFRWISPDQGLGPCAPDTLYSWGPKAKLVSIRNTLQDNKVWKGPANPGRLLFTTFSAIGTFGYGLIPIRFKIKPSTQFAWEHPDDGNTVQYFGFSVQQDYVIHDAAVIESWSFGTPEHYDEIVRDYLRFKSGQSWIGYIPYEANVGATFFGKRSLFIRIDSHDFTEDGLRAALLEMIRMILNREGRIYYSKNSCRNRKFEFETRNATYVNPFQYVTAPSDDLRPVVGVSSSGRNAGQFETAAPRKHRATNVDKASLLNSTPKLNPNSNQRAAIEQFGQITMDQDIN